MTENIDRVDTTVDELNARNANLESLVGLLRNQHARKIDVVVPAAKIHATGGNLRLEGVEAELSEDGVTTVDGVYRPTEDCDAQIAERFSIPVKYVRRMRSARRLDLWDANINGWLHGWRDDLAEAFPQINPAPSSPIPGDERSFLVRGFKGDTPDSGIARALLSDRYGIVDHLDVLFASLEGIGDAGVEVQIASCDLTDRRMYVKIAAPQIQAYAPALLEGYRSPFDGRQVGSGWTPERLARVAQAEGMQHDAPPVVFAGFVLSNSETGMGTWSITPQLQVEVCRNGLTITADALQGVHLGGKLDSGVIRWSQDTERKQLALIKAKARDAVATFLDVEYVKAKVAELETLAGTPVEDPTKTIEHVAKALSFTETQQNTILAHFIKGGQLTAGGVMQAVTSAAQTRVNPDSAYEMEAAAVKALRLAVAAQ